ncbi:MAG: transposase, partial [Bacteroidales bacterium]|nr:transposase [Bacteroidales bacterium]
CYVRHKKISGEGFENFLNDNEAQVFKITSYDLEKIRNKNYNNLKAHTQLWLDFWNDNNEQQKYPLRLNPEISITWREPKKSRVEKYGEVTKLYDPKKHNRYLHSQFTLITTFTENALSSEITYAFQDIKKKGEAIKDFNKQINDHFSKKIESNKLWFYGIDTGQVELATLCLIGSNGKPQMFQVLELKRDKYDYEKTGFLKNGTEKKYKAISNLSYFLNQSIYERTFRDGKFNQTFNELFEKKEVPAIDLSKAKLINGHIVEYGDIFSYDRLKKINKMRQEERKNALTLEKINHVRQALVSNMVGIINYLYQKFPGFIILEDNPQSWIEDERMKFEGRLERPLEWALYRKFQEVGLTPPISELVRLREEFKVAISKGKQTANQKLKQFGIVCFVNKEGTSLHCPSCGNKAYKDDKEIKQDKSKKIFRCKSCGYHNHNESKDYPGLDNNDKVAAFNIAKMGLKFFKI